MIKLLSLKELYVTAMCMFIFEIKPDQSEFAASQIHSNGIRDRDHVLYYVKSQGYSVDLQKITIHADTDDCEDFY